MPMVFPTALFADRLLWFCLLLSLLIIIVASWRASRGWPLISQKCSILLPALVGVLTFIWQFQFITSPGLHLHFVGMVMVTLIAGIHVSLIISACALSPQLDRNRAKILTACRDPGGRNITACAIEGIGNATSLPFGGNRVAMSAHQASTGMSLGIRTLQRLELYG